MSASKTSGVRLAAGWYRHDEIPFIAKPGDKLVRPKFVVLGHPGIYLPNGLVFHNTPPGEQMVSLEEYAAGYLIRVEAQPQHMRERAIYSAYQMLRNPSRYDLYTNNCDDSVNRALTGKPGSTQRVIITALIAGGIAAAIAKGRIPIR